MTFLSSRKPPFEKTKSSNDKSEVSFTEKLTRSIFGIFYQNHGLTPLEKFKFFDYCKVTFLSSKKLSLGKATSSDDETEDSFTET